MKHLRTGDKSLLVDDESADILMAYANELGRRGSSDLVRLRAIGADGNEVEVTFLLNAAAALVAETTNSGLDAPDNAGAVRYMLDRIHELNNPEQVVPGRMETLGDGL